MSVALGQRGMKQNSGCLHQDERRESALSQCIGERSQPALADDSTPELARVMLLVVGATLPRALSLRETARRLAMTPRTLQRRLRAEGVSHRELVERLRKQRAIELLTTTALSIEAVAVDIGFSDAAAFHRAFRRWTGLAPGRFRRLARPDADPIAEPTPDLAGFVADGVRRQWG